MDFAEKVAGDATSMTQEDVDGLRELGLSDADIADVVFAAAGAVLHEQGGRRVRRAARPRLRGARSTPELREALTVGRPIAEV